MSKKVLHVLVTELTADGAKLKKELAISLKETKTWGDRMSAIAKGVSLAGLAGGGTVAAGFAAITKVAINNADALYEQSQQTNLATEALSAYTYQAKMSGVTSEELNGALVKFNKTTADAFDGVGAGADAYKQLGISVVGTDGILKSNEVLLGEIADRFAQLQDGPSKTALAMDLFGRSVGAKLVPMLNGGTAEMKLFREEAERLGLIVDTETAAAANELNDNLDKLSLSVQGVGMRIAKDALPSLVKLTDTINDPEVQAGLASFASGVVEIGVVAVEAFAHLGKLYRLVTGFDVGNINHLNEQIDLVKSAIENPSERLRFFGKDGLIEYYSEEELKTELAKLMAQAKDVIAQNEFRDELDEFGWGDVFAPIPSEKLSPNVKPKKDPKLTVVGSDEWKIQQQQEINAMLEMERRERGAADEAVATQREKFRQIHEENLSAQNKVVDLEEYRHKRNQELLQQEMDELRSKGLLTQELEAEFQTAKEEQEAAHQARLKEIKDRAAAEDAVRLQMTLTAAENLFGSLADLAKKFKGENSRIYKAMFIAEKVASIARASIAITTGIAQAASLPFPANLGAMATVAGATAGLVDDIQSVNIAHGGLDYVPKESTFLLDRGERVLSPRQNKDLTQFLDAAPANQPNFNVNVYNYSSERIDVRQNGNTVDVIVGQVVNKINDQIARGVGVANTLQQTYALQRRGN
jgi:hypothetical protein